MQHAKAGDRSWNWSSRPRMQFLWLNHRSEFNVLPRLSCRHHGAAAYVGCSLSGSSLHSALLLQLLVGLSNADDRSFLDARQLSRTLSRQRVSADAVSLHVDRGSCDDPLALTRLSTCVLSFIPRREAQRPLLSVGNYSALGQLPGPSLRVEDDSGQRWRIEHAPAICASHSSPAGVFVI